MRHGETEWSVSGRHTGRTDVPLTDVGRRLAQRLGPRLAQRAFSLVITSPLSRASETAAMAGFAGVAEVVDDLSELDYGDYEGLTTAAIRAERPGWDVWRDGWPGGESLADAGVRADRVIARAVEADGDVACFAHGHLLRVLGARWLGLPAEAGAMLGLDTGAVSELGHERERRVLWLWNDASYTRAP